MNDINSEKFFDAACKCFLYVKYGIQSFHSNQIGSAPTNKVEERACRFCRKNHEHVRKVLKLVVRKAIRDGLNYQAFKQKIGITLRTWSNWDAGVTKPSGAK